MPLRRSPPSSCPTRTLCGVQFTLLSSVFRVLCPFRVSCIVDGGSQALGSVTVGTQGPGQLLQKPPHFPRWHCVRTAAGTSLGGPELPVKCVQCRALKRRDSSLRLSVTASLGEARAVHSGHRGPAGALEGQVTPRRGAPAGGHTSSPQHMCCGEQPRGLPRGVPASPTTAGTPSFAHRKGPQVCHRPAVGTQTTVRLSGDGHGHGLTAHLVGRRSGRHTSVTPTPSPLCTCDSMLPVTQGG